MPLTVLVLQTKLYQSILSPKSSEKEIKGFSEMDGVIPDQDSHSETQSTREEEEEEEEFSFVCGGEDTTHLAAEEAFINGQIKPVFPLFNRELFFSADELDSLYGNLPPVKRVFVQKKDGREATSSHCGWSNGNAVEVSPQVCKKSSSTGFSKLWRFKDFLGRSNSDGRDTFVFLNSSHAPPPKEDFPTSSVTKKTEKKASAAKVNGKVKRDKTTSLSAHEAYLRNKAKDEGKRRSYLPYRPELMGFFTNINGGLSKNTHPY